MFDVIKTGRIIKDIRNNKGMKQEECANKLGISRAALSSYENGSRTMDIDILYKFCALFDVSADYILGRAENPTVKPDLQAAIKYTGLSEKALKSFKQFEKLKNWEVDLSNEGAKGLINKLSMFTQMFETIDINSDIITDVLNKLLQLHDFYYLLLTLGMLHNNSTPHNINAAGLMKIENESDLLRYRISRLIEKISDQFDRRENIGEHNGKQG